MIEKSLKLTVQEKIQVTFIRLHLWHADFSIFSHFAHAVAHSSHASKWKVLRFKFRFSCLFCCSLVFSCWEVKFIQIGFLFSSFSSFSDDVLISTDWAMKIFETMMKKSCEISFENWQCWFLSSQRKERAKSCNISAAKSQRWESSRSEDCCNVEASLIVMYLSSVFSEFIDFLRWHLSICSVSALDSDNHDSSCVFWANSKYNSFKSVKLKFWFHEELKIVCKMNCMILLSFTLHIVSTSMSSISSENRRTFAHKDFMCNMSKLE